MKASTIVDEAKKWIGTVENPPKSNNVIFNTHYYGHEVNNPNAYFWCMVFVWDIFRMSGASDLFYDGKKCASCTTVMNWSKNKGKFVTKNFKPGDVLFYNFNKDAKSEHTGICVSDEGTYVTAIEGNTSSDNKSSQSNGDGVYVKSRKKTLILGAYRPDYEYEKQKYIFTLPSVDLKIGSKGYQVGLLQRFLNWYYGKDVLDVDNSFGPATQKVVKQFQKDTKIQVDGCVGPQTRAKIKEIADEGR